MNDAPWVWDCRNKKKELQITTMIMVAAVW